MLYLGCSLLRLAYCNSIGLQSQHGAYSFTGLPTTTAALLIPLVFLSNFVLSPTSTELVLLVTYLVLALLMISTIQVKKLQGSWYAFALMGAIAWLRYRDVDQCDPATQRVLEYLYQQQWID